jgi:hypothetical protein
MEESGLDRADAPCPFNCGPVTRRRAVRFITNGHCARIVYHGARYFHSLFVLQLDDFPNFIRAKAIWVAINKQLDRSIPSIKILSIALTAIKVCTASIFEDHSGVHESQFREMESTVFRAVGDLLDPFSVLNSMDQKNDRPRVVIPEFNMDMGRRQLDGIADLVESAVLQPEEENIARIMLKNAGWDTLLATLGRETWGDLDSDDSKASAAIIRPSNLAQRLIARDLQMLKQIVPLDAPEWIRNRKKTLDRADEDEEEEAGFSFL